MSSKMKDGSFATGDAAHFRLRHPLGPIALRRASPIRLAQWFCRVATVAMQHDSSFREWPAQADYRRTLLSFSAFTEPA
jgi:hypothetical protein